MLIVELKYKLIDSNMEEEHTEERIFYKSNDVKLTIDKNIIGLGSLILSERYVLH